MQPKQKVAAHRTKFNVSVARKAFGHLPHSLRLQLHTLRRLITTQRIGREKIITENKIFKNII